MSGSLKPSRPVVIPVWPIRQSPKLPSSPTPPKSAGSYAFSLLKAYFDMEQSGRPGGESRSSKLPCGHAMGLLFPLTTPKPYTANPVLSRGVISEPRHEKQYTTAIDRDCNPIQRHGRDFFGVQIFLKTKRSHRSQIPKGSGTPKF